MPFTTTPSLQHKRQRRSLPMRWKNNQNIDNNSSTSSINDGIVLPDEQHYTRTTAEHKLREIYKAGEDFNLIHTTVCGPTGGLLRGLLLGNAKSAGQSATVHELWNGRAKDDPLNTSLSFVGPQDKGMLAPRQATNCVYVGHTTKQFLDTLLRQFKDCLSLFNPQDRLRFWRGGKLNQSLVLALNGITPIQLDFAAMTDRGDQQINQEIMLCMIEFLLQQSNDKCVSIKSAQDAYSSLYLGANSRDTHSFDLREQTNNYFDSSVEHDVRHCFIFQSCCAAMKHLGYCNDFNTAVGIDAIWLPRVETHTVVDRKNDCILPFKVTVVHDFAPKAFHKEVIARMNELVYLIGLGGKRNAWLRSASTTSEPAPFTIGQDIYGGLPASNIEQKLLDIANLICEGQKSYVESQLGHGYLVTFAANQLLTVVGCLHDALFSRHCDFSHRLCTEMGCCRHTVNSSRHFLPQQHELQVITFVFCNSPLQLSTDLVYRNQEGKILSRVPLSNCCLHLQGPGSQMGTVTHEVTRNTNNGNEVGEETVYRMSITCRFVLDPIKNRLLFDKQLEKEVGYPPDPTTNYHCEYNQYRIFERMSADEMTSNVPLANAIHPKSGTSRAVQRRSFSRDMQSFAGAKINLLSRENSDTFSNIEPEQFKQFENYRYNQRCEFEGSAYNLWSSYDCVRFLFDQRILIHKQEREQTKHIEILPLVRKMVVGSDLPLAGCFPLPGDVFFLSHICEKAGLVHTTRSNPIFSARHGYPNIIILSRLYKNDWKLCIAYRNRVKEWVKNQSIPFLNKDFLGKLVICGSGGSPKRSGAVVTDYSKDTKDDASVVIPWKQNLTSPINQGLARLATDEQVVTVYVREDIMFNDNALEDTSGKDLSQCTFWGYFAATEYMTKKEKLADVTKELGLFTDELYGRKPTQQEEQLSRFRIVTHCKISLEFLFCNDQLQRQVDENHTADYKVRTLVQAQCEGRLQIYFPTGSQSNVMSMGNSCITHGAIGNLYLQLGGKEIVVLNTKATKKTKKNNEDEALLEDYTDEEEDLISSEADTVANFHCATALSSATYAEAFDCAMLLNYAGALRWMKRNLTQHTNVAKIRVKPLDVWDLPVGMCNHPHPMSSRLLDVNILFLLQVAHDSGLFEKTNTPQKGSRVQYTDDLVPDIVALVFQATLLRFTGRVKHFRTYSRLTNSFPMVPLPDQVGRFLVFMRTTLKGNADDRQNIGQWISCQHKNVIPKYTQTFVNFSSFATGLAKKLPNVVESMLRETSHKESVMCMNSLLQLVTQQENNTNLYWMAQQIIADVSEIFEFAFGGPLTESITLGFGARIGFTLLQKGNQSSVRQSPGMVLNQIVEMIQSIKRPIRHLHILGLERKLMEGHEIAIHKMNGRKFNVSDAEEILCRIYSAAKVTFGAYSSSENPRFGKPYCHPIRMHQHDKRNKMLDQTTETIMEIIVESMKATNVNIPEFCLRPGEGAWRAQISAEQDNS